MGGVLDLWERFASRRRNTAIQSYFLELQEISLKLHLVLLQPVHNMGSRGYGSHGSNGSHWNGKTIENRNVVDEPGKSIPSVCLLTDASPAGAQQHKSPVTFLKDSAVPPLLVKDITATAAASVEKLTCSDQTVYSYQQISCLDSVIRYLESCIIPVTVKRMYQFSSYTAFSMHASRSSDR
uniref:period circadian protein homolog 2-like n=1 Tax=Oncorhynchus gorbuscha TaxID=8017 RepID=UPI001EAEC836|nr:period circadian protein homolog 2-like [Oncorhynchus gorbuscha]